MYNRDKPVNSSILDLRSCIDGSYDAQFVILSDDQDEVFEYTFIECLLLMGNFRKFFSSSTCAFDGLIIVYTKAFSLWKRQKSYHRGPY